MQLQELITVARTLLDDQESTATDPRDLLWSDDELLLWANEAIVEAAVRTQAMSENRAYTFSGTSVAPLGDDVLRVDEMARIDYGGTPPAIDVHVLTEDEYSVDWGRRSGTPTRVAYLSVPSELHIDAVPQSTVTVYVDVRYVPLANYALGDTIPLPLRYHTHLVDWVLYRAYSKKDAETEDVARAASAQAAFDAAFGSAQSFTSDVVMRETRRQRTKAVYF